MRVWQSLKISCFVSNRDHINCLGWDFIAYPAFIGPITEGKGNFRFRDFYKPGTTGRLISYMDDLLISVENKDKYIEKSIVNKNMISSVPAVLLTAASILLSYIILLPIQSLL